MTDTEIIKACPFCGEKAHLDRHDIFCDCGAKITIPLYVEGKESVDGFPTYKEARQQMIEAWNSRVDEETINRQKAEIERLSNFVTEERVIEIAQEMIPKIAKQARNEAVKEFACELERSLINMPQKDINYSNLVEHIENLVKEKVGDADAFSNRAL